LTVKKSSRTPAPPALLQRYQKELRPDVALFFDSQRFYPKLQSVYETFDATCTEMPSLRRSLVGGGYTEWNPINQRVIFYSEMKGPRIDFRFDHSFQSFFLPLSNLHEIEHLLLFEPFYIGKLPIGSLNWFLEVYFSLEATSVWHMEHTISPALNSPFPDKERFLDRAGLTTKRYSQKRAFKNANLSSSQTLNCYLDSFTGRRSLLVGKNDVFQFNLVSRFYGFYFESLAPLKFFYKELSEVGAFKEYYERFCNVPGLPTFLPDDFEAIESQQSLRKYCHQFFFKEIFLIDGLDKNQRNRIRVRRKLQTRAYFALSIRETLNSKNYFSTLKSRPLRKVEQDAAFAKAAIQIYLDKIEDLLHQLANGAAAQKVETLSQTNDRYYEREVRNRFENSSLWISKRTQFFQARKDLQSGPIDANSLNPTRREMQSIHQILVRGLKENSFDSEQMSSIGSNFDLSNWKDRITSPDLAPIWSRKLSDCQPLKNRFSELLFVFG
jgi:hypothetical protein